MEKPPPTTVGVIGWLRKNLFSSWGNSLITVVMIGLLVRLGIPLVRWIFLQARWQVISRNRDVILWGRYPSDQAWRLGAGLAVIIVLGTASLIIFRMDQQAKARRAAIQAWVLIPLILVLLLRGFTLPTPLTIANNLGYYLFRPDVLPQLEQAWRGPLVMLLVAIMGALTWSLIPGQLGRALSAAAVLLVFGLMVPLGLQGQSILPGLMLPRLIGILLLAGIGLLAGRQAGQALSAIEAPGRGLAIAWAVVLVLGVLLLTSFDIGVPSLSPVDVLPIVQPAIWSGILLTLVLSVVSIVASFPIGILLALGRRSSLPIVKAVCILMIEIVRGVPLITILFMAQVMLPLFFPLELTIDRVVRAMAGMTIFTAAYLAEIVRGGLQAVRHEQIEAARALGLSELMVTGLVVLPQALRAVIPAIMGQFVSIFKDTSLVAIVGLLDLLGILQSIIKQREFVGTVREVYLFAAGFYFILSYAMSEASRRLEVRLGVGQR
jgi:general L-amino acid transport system permease protein